ncbi:MAG: hypothetical protein EAX91_01565 [Candidatus Lokiarchaeota archaeon]|nr:hypothetical protein [Candidatus Lokiarchaeota archaeon]
MSSTKGFAWSFVFFLTAAIYGSIPTHLIVNYWAWLGTLRDISGEPVYTLLLFILFCWIVALLITLIYIVAGIRAIVQRKNEDSGISKGIYRYGMVSTILVVAFMIVWFILFQEIAFFSMLPPPL